LARKATLLLLTGGWGKSRLEQALQAAHQAAARDLIEVLLNAGLIEQAVVATDDPAWGRTLRDLPVTLDLDPAGIPFHFGRRLVELVQRYDAERVLYAGGGSAPLLQIQQWADVLDRLEHADRLVIANNLHSCDWAAFTPASQAGALIANQTNDNAMAWTLANEGGFPCRTLKPSAGSRFDIDTPVDLLIAKRHPAIGPHLSRYLDDLGWTSAQLDDVLAEMARAGGSLIVAGRASPEGWQALQRATRCWVRVFAEERGMRASGRQGRGEVRSLLGDYLDLIGVRPFFDALARLANGVLLDNRVILASRGLWPSTLDRFNSDLYRWDHVEDPFLRSLTRAAAESPIPVVMGGHTVVAGGLMAAVEALDVGHTSSQEESSLCRPFS
jgi:hypothetical protein